MNLWPNIFRILWVIPGVETQTFSYLNSLSPLHFTSSTANVLSIKLRKNDIVRLSLAWWREKIWFPPYIWTLIFFKTRLEAKENHEQIQNLLFSFLHPGAKLFSKFWLTPHGRTAKIEEGGFSECWKLPLVSFIDKCHSFYQIQSIYISHNKLVIPNL